MATQEQMWNSVRETLDVFSGKLMDAEERVKKQSDRVSTLSAKVDGLEAQTGSMQMRIATLERQMNAIAYQQIEQ